MRSVLLFFIFCFGFSLSSLDAQCPLSGTNWQTGAAPSAGCTWVNSTTCAYFDEYSTFTGLSSAQTYRVRAQFTGGVSPYSFNLYNSSVGGSAPIAFTNGSAGPLFIDVPSGTSGTVYVKNFASGCSNIGDFCHTFSIECTSCAPIAPTQPTAGTITSMSATITFTSGNILEYGPTGFTPGTDGNAGGGIVINPATSPQVIMGLTPSTAYQVYVRTLCGSSYSPNSPVRNFTTLAPPPSCPAGLGTPVSIPTLPYDSGSGQTTCGNGNNVTTTNATICGNTNYYLAEDKTYIFTPTVSGVHTILLTTAANYDAGIMLYEGCPFLGSGGTCVANAQAVGGLTRTITPTLSAGVTYYLVADNWPSPACMASYRLQIDPPIPAPLNDLCSNSFVLANGTSGSLTGTTIGSGNEITNVSCDGFNNPNGDVWYKITTDNDAISGETLIITISPSALQDYAIYLYSGSCGALVYETCADLFEDGITETINFTVTSDLPVDYFLRVKQWSASSGTFTLSANGTALPITISKISAHNMGKNNMITWTTSSEVNNDVQMVERSKDGISGWEMVGKVNGTNSRETVTYEVYDNNPYNTSFYRVHSVDFDGKEQFSKIVSVQREGRSGIITSIQPNPTANFVEIDLQPEFDGDITYTILDVTGKLLKTAVFSANNDALNTHTLDMSDLQSGLYFVTIQGGGINQNTKIIKQ